VLLYVLTDILKLLHPFMPFITEEIWQALPHDGEALMIARYLVEVLAHFLRERVELREHPLVLELQRLGQLVFVDGEVHHHEAGSIPELVFWVARMIFSGLEQMKDIPFPTVFIHGLVRDG